MVEELDNSESHFFRRSKVDASELEGSGTRGQSYGQRRSIGFMFLHDGRANRLLIKNMKLFLNNR
jgi:glutamate synthase domain-containing protein 3